MRMITNDKQQFSHSAAIIYNLCGTRIRWFVYDGIALYWFDYESIISFCDILNMSSNHF